MFSVSRVCFLTAAVSLLKSNNDPENLRRQIQRLGCGDRVVLLVLPNCSSANLSHCVNPQVDPSHPFNVAALAEKGLCSV